MTLIGRVACMVVALAPLRAVAHPQLESAVPAVGSTVSAPPTAVSLVFSEGVEPQFSRVVVVNAAGLRVDRNDLAAAPGDPRTIGIGLMKLGPGTYSVTWRVTGTDTHKTQGKYRFTVAP
jgi:methionine-rich copper-binding protein CopC